MPNENLSLLRPTSIVVDAPPEPPADDLVSLPNKRKLLAVAEPDA